MPDPRPPLRSVQREFWRLIRAGSSTEQAAAEVGVSKRSGERWVQQRGGMPGLSLVEPTASRALTLLERERIAAGLAAGDSLTAIAAELDRATSTVSREVGANMRHRRSRRVGQQRADGTRIRLHGLDWRVDWEYSPSRAQRRADANLARPKQSVLEDNDRLREYVQDQLEQEHSPEQIANRLRLDFPEGEEMRVSHETIYKALYVQGRGVLRRDLAKRLRTGRAVRKPRRKPGQRLPRPGKIPDMVPISQRPPEVADRAVPGHWEGDLILGSVASASAIGTLVERTSRFTLLLHLPDGHGADAVAAAMIEATSNLPETLRKTLTWDQGVEMTRHLRIAAATDLDIYFCDPHSPWQRGSNENTNGLLRQYFPKGTDLSVHTAEDLAFVAAKLNNRPRKTLNWATPAEVLTRLLSEASSTDVATTA
jgi:IS30 family transposase